MSVRKRTWINAKGEEKTSWVVDYVDTQGKRRLKTFRLKKQADQFATTAAVEVREGVHVADSASVTVKEACDFWTASCKNANLERSTLAAYRTHVELHIKPFIGDTKLSALTIPMVRTFEDDLQESGRSPVLRRKVIASLSSIISDAQERGLVGRNIVRDLKSRRRGSDNRLAKRQQRRLIVGEDIPSREEIKALIGTLDGRWRPLILTAIFTGLRASELRGLRWSDIDFDKRMLRVHQRADFFNEIGRPKSATSERSIPLPPMVITALKEWKLACPNGELDLVFPNGKGNIEQLNNIVRRGLQPAEIAAGIAFDTGKKDKRGEPIMKAKYPGLHALRHFYASWCINRIEDGGLGLPPKLVQERMGHSTIGMTMDVYGHLFPRDDHGDELAAAEMALLS
ncbi:site-specific integrase [Martelella alba]|uniref:Site-specific integrase n=1 Tax=Martelella alba TaxID=2590451 RepID=A0A506U5G3_9HYPH|nr:site-specific integrase [Martelella alba]TPW27799.1 site-specific integrase [Martelella alba]